MLKRLLPLCLFALASALPAQTRVANTPATAAPDNAVTVGPASLATTAKAIYPMQAALVQSLSSKTLAPGGHVLARLEKDWTDGACKLSKGAVIRGEVLRVEPWSSKTKHTSASLLFHYRCEDRDPQTLTWIALLAPENLDLAGLHDGNPVEQQAFRSSSFGQAGNFGSPSGGGSGSPGDLSGRQNPNLPVFLGTREDHSRPAAVKTGQVWRVPDVTLRVGAGPDESTVLETRKQSLHLPAGSALVLLPAAVAVVESAPPSPNAASVTATTPKPRKPEFVELTACAAPSCTQTSAVSAPREEPRPTLTLSLAGQRYARIRQAAMSRLDEGTALAFLGPHHLLFTFDPHLLVTREPEDRPEDRPHMVRAVLFNLTTARVERTLEWRVPDSRPYLWAVGSDRVLIHDGRRLSWLGPNLRRQTAWTPDGAIAFVRLSPDRRHVAVGVIHELHGHEEHAELAAVDVNGPEEQVAVHLLDDRMQPVGPATTESSRALAPVLSDGGRIALLHMGGQRWHYKEINWSEAAQDAPSPEAARDHRPGEASPDRSRSVAFVTSACIPEMSSLSGGLLLVTGCESRSLDHWYRVLRPNGSPVLKGVLHPQDLSPLPAPGGGDIGFALTLPTGGPNYARGSTFHPEDIDSESVRVHRCSDGAPLFTARIQQPAATAQPTSLSPDGDRLALLDGDHIHIYTLSAPPNSLAAR